MTQMVTRCPKCATAFRITSTQLESAKGAVRCGSCLHIFKAQDYLVKSASSPATTQTTQATTTPANIKTATPAKATPKPASLKAFDLDKGMPVTKPVIDKTKALADEDEDLLISDDMDNAAEKESSYDFDGFFDIDMQPKQTVSLFGREIRYDEPKDDDDEEDTDESWAESLLDDEDDHTHQLRKNTPVSAPAKVASPAATLSPSTAEVNPSAAQTAAHEPASTYTGPVFSLISDDSEASETYSKEPKSHNDEHVFSEAFLNATRAPDAPTETPNSFAAALFDTESDSEEAETEEPEKNASKRPVKSSKIRAFDTSRAALLMNIMPAPLEFTSRRMRRWYQKKLWSSLAAIMSIMLILQIAYFKFDHLSRIEPYRTAYLFICPLLSCEVPPLVDVAQIEATNLIVRNHPDAANALLVDAILINKAPFEQPFPDLILSFSTIDDVPVASRRFTPKEYLFGELAGMKHIPMHQPVHITLEISDPGPDAPNYSLITH